MSSLIFFLFRDPILSLFASGEHNNWEHSYIIIRDRGEWNGFQPLVWNLQRWLSSDLAPSGCFVWFLVWLSCPLKHSPFFGNKTAAINVWSTFPVDHTVRSHWSRSFGQKKWHELSWTVIVLKKKCCTWKANQVRRTQLTPPCFLSCHNTGEQAPGSRYPTCTCVDSQSRLCHLHL